MEAKSVIVKNGAIVDASVTDRPRRSREEKSYVIVDDRNEDEQAEEAERSFAEEAEKPNVNSGARLTKRMDA